MESYVEMKERKAKVLKEQIDEQLRKNSTMTCFDISPMTEKELKEAISMLINKDSREEFRVNWRAIFGYKPEQGYVTLVCSAGS